MPAFFYNYNHYNSKLMAELLEEQRLLEVNKILDRRMHVKPLNEGEFVKYRLKKADQTDVTRTEESSGLKLKHQQVYSFPGKKRIYDPFQKRKVMIQNVMSFKYEKMPTGEMKEVPILARLTFPKEGEIIITHRDNDKYAFLERLDENESNEFRDPNVKAIYYRVDVKKQAAQELEKDYVKVDAMLWVRDANETEVKSIYNYLDKETRKEINADSFEQMKKGIFKLAEKNPILVLKGSTNKLAKVKVQVMEAERYRIISFSEGGDGEERRWVLIAGKPETICKIEPGTHKIDGLVKFFTSDSNGKDWYQKIIDELKKVLEYKR